MRLRFGRPSLSVLIAFAMLIGVIFYVWDNASPTAPPDPDIAQLPPTLTPNVPDTASTNIPAASTRTPAPTIERPIDRSSAGDPDLDRMTSVTSISRQIGFRQEIPDNVSVFIPRAGIYSQVIQAYLDDTSWDVSQLGTRVGHLEGTAWLDEPGNVVLSGHVEMRDGRPGIFANLDELRVDDVVILRQSSTEYRYIITEIRTVAPTDLSPVMPTSDDRLTLITCNTYDFFSDSYLERMIIVAERLN
jgi:LPXTG-site transpeptidase (sortase) family protein